MSVAAGPLAGRAVVVTRPRGQSGPLTEALVRLGADVLELPAIALVDPPDWGPFDEALARIEVYDWLVFTSANAFERAALRARDRGRDLVALLAGGTRPRVASIGEATARRLRTAGIPVGLVAPEAHAEGLVAAFAGEGIAGSRVLLPRALDAREALPDGLRMAGATVDVAPVYHAVAAAADPAPVVAALRAGRVAAVTLLSARTARAFVDALPVPEVERDALLARTRAVVIGPVTAAAVAGMGFAAVVEARDASTAGVVAAVVSALEGAAS
jgi:uroporphyrinogen III methyltransferase/synthase